MCMSMYTVFTVIGFYLHHMHGVPWPATLEISDNGLRLIERGHDTL